ncbi:MAG: hypothetical protein NC127_02860 [Muribaculum sp.]|nr:hypothetical protein [Muribaculum sp.]
MRYFRYNIASILLLLTLFASSLTANARSEELIKEVSQLGTNYPHPNSNYSIDKLLDDETSTAFLTDDSQTGDQHYLAVKLNGEILMQKYDDGKTDNLVIVLTRPVREAFPNQNMPTERNPTAMEIHYTKQDLSALDLSKQEDLDKIQWETKVLARVYFLNRGSGTTELSEHLSLDELAKSIKGSDLSESENPADYVKKITGLKFIVTMNNGRYFAGTTAEEKAKKIRPMSLAGFQIYKVKDGDRVVGRWVDRFRLDTDIQYRYDKFNFEHTQGILHPRNRNIGKVDLAKDDDAMATLDLWDSYNQYFDADGKWIADTAYLNKNGIEMPDYSWVTKNNNPITLNDTVTPFDPNLKLQRTATVEHLLYAVQGEPIVLYPFYTLPSTGAYNENFIHWYDYTTGGHVTDGVHAELLGFVADPSEVFHSQNHGWYTSTTFQTDRKEVGMLSESNTYEISSIEDYIAFVKKVNEDLEIFSNAILKNDIDFQGATVDPIGCQVSTPWRGTFKGNGHTLKNLHVKTSEEGCGMFGNVGDGAVIENLVIDSSCSISGGERVGFVGALRNGGSLILQGIVNHANVSGKGNVGGLLGEVSNSPSKDAKVQILNCAFTGEVSSTNDAQALVIAWLGRVDNNATQTVQFYYTLKNVIVTGTGKKLNKDMQIIRHGTDNRTQNTDGSSKFHITVENCFQPDGYQNWSVFDKTNVNTTEFIANFDLGEWTVNESEGAIFPTPKTFDASISLESSGGLIFEPKTPSRKYGTFATFFHPKLPFAENGDMRPLCKDEFVIAADMAQNFSLKDNVVDNGDGTGTIYEPVVQFRHIFRVKDGVKFANDNMSTVKGNRAFIKQNRRRITAVANKRFQVRLDHPYPAEKTTRGVFYYKLDKDDYRRICSRKIRVTKKGESGEFQAPMAVWDTYEMEGDGTQLILKDGKPVRRTDTNVKFYPSGLFDGQGSRTVDDVNYYVCGGGGHFFRMLECDGVPEGTYIVQVIGTGYDGEIIMLDDPDGLAKNDDERRLLVQEFEITFLPEEASLMVTEEELNNNYPDLAPDKLEEKFGGHSNIIDFDEFRFLETLPNANNYLANRPNDSYGEVMPENQEAKYLRWPLPWEQSNYGFGYNVRSDYAMHMITNSQSATPYHSNGLSKVNNSRGNTDYGKGLFDRRFYETLKDPSKEVEKGYFYYVNAADDPGIIARLELRKFCPGTKIYVSCWISEFSNSDESANLSFNFVARLQDGERVPMHSHITGYVQQGSEGLDKRGKWMYVYSSFVPILTDKDIPADNPIDHYEIELDNNAKSSGGADYAVDDIRLFTVKPEFEARQTNPLCMAADHVDVQISADFNVLLQNLGEAEAETAAEGKDIELFYTFIRKKEFDKAMIEKPNDYQAIFDASVLKFDYNGTSDPTSTYGKIILNTFFKGNTEYNANESHDSNRAYWSKENGTDLIIFNTDPKDSTMEPGKEYYIAILTKTTGDDFGDNITEPTGSLFIEQGILDDCAKKCLFTVQASHVVKVDGIIRDQMREIDACRNQSPVVQVDLYGLPEELSGSDGITQSQLVEVEKNAVFDWFAGPMDDFIQIKDGDLTLWDALIGFRDVYRDASDLSGEPQGDKYTEQMRNLLKQYVEMDPEGKRSPSLFLSQSSYVFPPLVLDDGQDKHDAYVLALPIPKDTVLDEKRLHICSQPTEVHIVVLQRAPLLAHGISTINYPEAISDVPLRISLNRMELASTSNADALSHQTPLVLPFRKINPVSPNVSELVIPDVNLGSPIYLVSTNDPEYKNLWPGDGTTTDNNGLWEVGLVNELAAQKGNEASGHVNLAFYNSIDGDEGIKFKEGYEYRMRFLYKEKATETQSPQNVAGEGDNADEGDETEGDDKEEEEEEVCIGHVVFTVKIVPEYQKWTGAADNLNWNNDSNWTRVASSELYRAHSATDKFTTDGSNRRQFSYAPLDFTKTVIPKDSPTVPWLFDAEIDKGQTVLGTNYDWNPSPSVNANAGAATILVQYDMIERRADNGTYCRPWLAHYCDQIHFEPNSEIMNQQYLTYNKAWVDMEIDHGRWYTLSAPLKAVVAGDMYLPKDGARQETEMFNNINFSSDLNDRFRPAVYQRSWNKATAMVYEMEGRQDRNVAVRTAWSNVFNDVKESYSTSTGLGYSIKADVSDMTSHRPDTDGKVLFRFPKADESYSYFSKDGLTQGDNQSVARPADYSSHYWLNDTHGKLTIEADKTGADSKYFLVGNPFMAHLDMKKFLEKNSDKVTMKYWIVSADSNNATVITGDGTVVGTDGTESATVAPMQGFFVEAINAAKSLTLDYDETMMCTPGFNTDSAILYTMSRGSSSLEGLTVTALSNDYFDSSKAILMIDPAASQDYDQAEDAVLFADTELIEAPMVYTVAGNTAASINRLPDPDKVEIGLIAKADEDVTLLFEGVGSMSDYMLYDTLTGEYTPIEEGMEYPVRGTVAGRLYITSGIADETLPRINVAVDGRMVRVTTGRDELNVSVYDTVGRRIRYIDNGINEVSFSLEAGVFVVEAMDGEERLSKKILVR